MHLRERQREAAASLTESTSSYLHWPSISGSNGCQLRQLSRPLHGPDLRKSDETICKYDRPEHQQGDVPAEVKGKPSAKHEQHQAKQRLSLFPPADEQTSPKRHQYAGCHWTKDFAKVQNAAADHSRGNGGKDTEFSFVTLESAPFRVVNSNQRL